MDVAPDPGDGALRRGSVIGRRYRVEAAIGSGAMGRVYRVVHDTLELPLALKILHPELSVIPEVRQRLEREARLSAWLDHPAVVQVTDFGVHEGRPFLVMRLVEGEELAARMERGPVPPSEAVEIGVILCEGLAHAHGLGLIHRDLKPDNVVLTARGPRILDFGLARAVASDDPRLTRTGLVCGTPRYMSPEQASGDAIDIRSDVYALGVLLHEMLRGQPLFDGPNAAAVLRRQIIDAPPPLRLGRDPRVDTHRLAAVVERSLAKDPHRRHPDASALAEDLAKCRIEGPRLLRSRWPLVAVGVLAAVLGGWVTSRILRDPLVEARAAFAAGQLEMAERAARARLREQPGEPRAQFVLGQIAWARDDAAAAARAWAAAVDAEAELAASANLVEDLPKVAQRLFLGDRRDRALGATLVETVAERAQARAAPLLARLTTDAPTFHHRRTAYEALERIGATDEIDPFVFLASELSANPTSRCELRRWYVARLAALEDPRAEPVVSEERSRRGSGCMVP